MHTPFQVVIKRRGIVRSYSLHCKTVTLSGGVIQQIHYFRRDGQSSSQPQPTAYEVNEPLRGGLDDSHFEAVATALIRTTNCSREVAVQAAADLARTLVPLTRGETQELKRRLQNKH